MPVRRAKHPTPTYVVDAAGEPIHVGGHCGLYVDMAPDEAPPQPGDWIATPAGSRYLVDHAQLVARRSPTSAVRYRLRTLRLPKHTTPPLDVRVIWLSWYPRGTTR